MHDALAVTIAKVEDVAEGIRSYELVPSQGRLPSFEAGAHIDVRVRDGLVRQFSLCNRPGETHRYVIAVLREENGRGGSAAVHESFAAGLPVRISPPRNHFPLVRDASRHLLLAGGIGVTPLLAMARHLLATGGDFTMHYCARTVARMAFRGELSAPPFGAHVVLHFDDGPAAQQLDLPGLLARQPEGTHVYYCGPAGFMAAVRETALAQGVPAASLHCEYFTAPAILARPGSGFEVRLARRGLTVWIPENKTIIEVLAERDIFVETSCEQGVCGTCITRVLDGVPDHRDVFFTDAEKAANDQMTVCCSRAKTAYLVLDL
jgi:vanillate O-demethylase ferredoxin subunit